MNARNDSSKGHSKQSSSEKFKDIYSNDRKIIKPKGNKVTPTLISPKISINQESNDQETPQNLGENFDGCFYFEFSQNNLKAIKNASKFEELKANNYDFVILVTGYDEGIDEYNKTIKGIANNLKDFEDNGENVAIVFIIDGIEGFCKGMEKEKNSVLNSNRRNNKGKNYYDTILSFYKTDELKKFENIVKSKHEEKINGLTSEIIVNENTNIELKNDPQSHRVVDTAIQIEESKSEINDKQENEAVKEKNSEKYGNADFKHSAPENINLINKEEENISITSIKSDFSITFFKNGFKEDNPNKESKGVESSLFFCIKEKNKKKLNSQTWFLRGFCKAFNPKYFMFIDAGTVPKKNSLIYIYQCLKNNINIAGCCGEIIPESSICMDIINQAQIVEYKFSHIFDKSFENLFGFISVLPGAFSAYRYECFTDEILDIYFFTESRQTISLFDANMYLAEDRILCLELMCQKGRKNLLKYISASKATTDCPQTLDKLMVQRRRWINGTWFSTIYVLLNWRKILKSDHSKRRKFFFSLLMIYNAVYALFTWLQVSILYLSFSISLKRTLDESSNDMNKLNKISTPLIMLYVSSLIAIMISSFSVKPDKIKHFLLYIATVFCLYTYLTLLLTLKFLFSKHKMADIESTNSQSVYAMITIIAFAIIALLKHPIDSFWKVLKGIFAYFCMTGSYSNIFLINAIANIHDVTWGNRLSNEDLNDNQLSSYEAQRITWVIIWIISNSLFSAFFNWTDGQDDHNASLYFNILTWIIFFLIFFKIFGGVIYFYCIARCGCRKSNFRDDRSRRI